MSLQLVENTEQRKMGIVDVSIDKRFAADDVGGYNGSIRWVQRSTSGAAVGSNVSRMSSAPNSGGIDDDSTILVASMLHTFYTPLIVVIGSVGNILSVVVFFRLKLRKLSSSFYLVALGISDTIFLLTNSSSWLITELDSALNLEIVCKVTNYLCGVSSVLSAWFVVAFTVERFIAVLYPLKRQTMCTVRRAKMISIGIVIGGLLHCVPLLYFFGYLSYDDSCGVGKEVWAMMTFQEHIFSITYGTMECIEA